MNGRIVKGLISKAKTYMLKGPRISRFFNLRFLRLVNFKEHNIYFFDVVYYF